MQAKYGTGTVNFKNGKWVWTGYYKDDTGKIKRPTKSFNTEKEALLFQAEQTSKTLIKKEMRSEDITLKRVFKLWLQETNEVSETTKRSIKANFEKHILPTIGENKIKKLSVVSFERYLNNLIKKGMSEKTTYNIYTDLKTIIKWAIKKGIIYENPLSEMKPPKQRNKKTISNNLTMEEYEKIMLNEENQKNFFYNIILFLGETGIRISEIAFKENDIQKINHNGEDIYFIRLNKSIKRTLNEDNKTTTLRIIENMKTKDSERTIFLNGFALSAVNKQIEWKKEHKIYNPYIFTSSTGTLIEERNILRQFHKFCENAGVEKRGLHSLRKCFINRSLQNGITPFDLSKFTGHSIQTMYKYYHDLNIQAGIKIIEASEKR